MSNGLIRRDFVTEPNFGTLDFYSFEDDSSILRAFTPEAMVEIYIEDRKLNLSVGGVTSNIPRGYLNRFRNNEDDFLSPTISILSFIESKAITCILPELQAWQFNIFKGLG